MLKKERAVLDVASFLLGKVSSESIENVVKVAWSLTLLRRRMESLPRNAGGLVLGKPSAALLRQSKNGAPP